MCIDIYLIMPVKRDFYYFFYYIYLLDANATGSELNGSYFVLL